MTIWLAPLCRSRKRTSLCLGCPNWDNEPRRPNRGISFVASTPGKYGELLAWACRTVLHTNAADLFLSFGVFCYLPLMKIHRAAAPGSIVLFDIISEKSLAGPLLDRWLDSGLNYPTFLATEYVEELFVDAGFSLGDCFTSKYGPAVSEFLVFRKNGPSLV